MTGGLIHGQPGRGCFNILTEEWSISHQTASITDCPGRRKERDRGAPHMNIARLCLGLFLALTAMPGLAADAGIATIVDGVARVLRGSVWYRLAPGAPIQESDVIDAGERAQVQIELTGGGTLNLVGPASLYVATLPWRNDKLEGAVEFGLERGWLKLVASAPGVAVRVRTPGALVSVSESTIVVRYEGKMFEMFIESGSARIAEAARSGRDGPPRDAKSGEFWSRDGDKPFSTERRAPPKFVASMPRHLTDRLANLAARFKGQKAQLAVDREITLAEADPWLTSQYRRQFARRLGGRLADPTFRKAVEANIAAYPEFDRVLHPEKYPAVPGTPATTTAPPPTASPAPTAGAPKAGTPPIASPPPSAPPKPAQRGSLPFHSWT